LSEERDRLSCRFLRTSRSVYQKPVKGSGARTCDREPEKSREIGSLLESEQHSSESTSPHFANLIATTITTANIAAGIQVKGPRMSMTAEEFHGGNEGRQNFWKWDAPFSEVLYHPREVVQFSSSRQHEGVPDDDPHEQWTCPPEIGGDACWQQNEKIDNEFHGVSPAVLNRREVVTCGPDLGRIADLDQSFVASDLVVTPAYPKLCSAVKVSSSQMLVAETLAVRKSIPRCSPLAHPWLVRRREEVASSELTRIAR
jgi:hypothetical protein